MFSQSLACKTHIGHKTDYDIEGLGLVSRSFTSLNIKASPFAKIYYSVWSVHCHAQELKWLGVGLHSPELLTNFFGTI